MREVGIDVVFARLAVRRWRYNASDSEVAPPCVPDPVVQERLPTLQSSTKLVDTAPEVLLMTCSRLPPQQYSKERPSMRRLCFTKVVRV